CRRRPGGAGHRRVQCRGPGRRRHGTGRRRAHPGAAAPPAGASSAPRLPAAAYLALILPSGGVHPVSPRRRGGTRRAGLSSLDRSGALLPVDAASTAVVVLHWLTVTVLYMWIIRCQRRGLR